MSHFETHFEFVNFCLNLLHGKLPSYCFYDDDLDAMKFWDELSDEEYETIHIYLTEFNYIDDLDPVNEEMSIKNQVMTFVDTFFISD